VIHESPVFSGDHVTDSLTAGLFWRSGSGLRIADRGLRNIILPRSGGADSLIASFFWRSGGGFHDRQFFLVIM